MRYFQFLESLDDQHLKDHKIMNKKSVTDWIESYQSNTSDRYIDSVIALCDRHFIKVEEIKRFLSYEIINSIRDEAIQRNALKRECFNKIEKR